MIGSEKRIQNLITSILFLIIGITAGYYFGVEGYEVKLKQNITEIEIINKTSEVPESVDFEHFWEVWDKLTLQHIKRPIDPNVLLDGAIKGMVESIGDPYTNYLDAAQNNESRSALNGQYEGIGAQLGYDDAENLIVVAPLDGSPASVAGIKSGDKIIEIENISTVGLSIAEAVNKIRGPAGTNITLTLARSGLEENFKTTITRDTIKLDSVTWEDKGDGIAYIRLSRFGQTTVEEWSRATSEIYTQMPNLKAIILDVRNNPGGFLDGAVYIASEFIPSGVIVTEDFSDGTKTELKVDHKGKFIDKKIKIAVLINEGSASASEIVAAALKERREAILVGTRTFGKGSVQKPEEFNDGSALHVTIAKWITPDGNWIDKHNAEFKDSKYNEYDESGKMIVGGVKPDHLIEFSGEDIIDENDVQLEKAMELVK